MGYTSSCKECHLDSAANWRARNKDYFKKWKKNNARWYAEYNRKNKKKLQIASRKRYLRHRECYLAENKERLETDGEFRQYHMKKSREWNENNKQHALEYRRKNKKRIQKTSRRSYLKHQERYLGNGKKRRENDEEFRQYHMEKAREWRGKNRGRVNELYQRRIARIKGQTPDNTDKYKVRKIYEFAAELNAAAGPGTYHVDHIIPIAKGGLHHHDNLQIIPGWVNVRKHAQLIDVKGIRWADIEQLP